jgi:ATP-dependent DNA ligase
VLDGEAVAGDGSEGIQAVFEARTRPGSPIAFAAFDVLELAGARVMGEPWTARRKRLERIAVRLDRPRAIRDHPSLAARAGGGE